MEIAEQLSTKKILLQYSGGKDSTACLLKLCEQNANFEAIHFTHAYSYSIPTKEAIRLCNIYNVKLNIVDVTKEIDSIFLNDFKLRPCKYCKKIMDQKTIDFAIKNNFSIICVGDTKSDSTQKNRVESSSQNIFFSSYFSDMLSLPENLLIYRPVIDLDNKAILDYLNSKNVNLLRVGDTGDKYFEYSREGCPLQFKDFGCSYTKELMEDLLKINTDLSEYARSLGIKASIHLPSNFIVTIPKGYEDKCRNYLMSKGYAIPQTKTQIKHLYQGYVKIYKELLDINILEISINRFCECMNNKNIKSEKSSYSLVYNGELFDIHIFVDNILKTFNFTITSTSKIEIAKMENLLTEIYHTYNYSITHLLYDSI